MSEAARWGAIILAGGRARRLDGRDKTMFERGGRALLQRAVDAAAGCQPITIVGPHRSAISGAEWTREEPPFGGPAAAIRSALTNWASGSSPSMPDLTLVLAGDLVRPDAVTAHLREVVAGALTPALDGICLGDDFDHPQWLAGVYRTTALRSGAEALPDDAAHASIRALMTDLRLAVIPAPPAVTADIDTWDDLADAGVTPSHKEHA